MLRSLDFAAIDKKDDVLDVFELSSVGSKILVKGSSAPAMAAGVNIRIIIAMPLSRGMATRMFSPHHFRH